MTFMFPDGRALDDAEPQDAARMLSTTFELLARYLANGGPEELERPVMVEALTHISATMKVWAEFGRWRNPDLERRAKELEQLIVDFSGHHVTDFTVSCPACNAERRLRAIAKELAPEKAS